jgi:hypothetical protein
MNIKWLLPLLIIIAMALYFSYSSKAQQVTSPLILGPSTSRPACTEASRGQIYTSNGLLGIADVTEVCQKNALDTYAWKIISVI